MTVSTPRWRDLLARLQFFILTIGAVVIPIVVVTPASDPFRHPKELLFVGLAILLAAITTANRILGDGATVAWPRPIALIVMATMFWAAVATLTSSNMAVSERPLLIASCGLMLFAAAFNSFASSSSTTLLIVLFPAFVNGVIALGQRTNLWSIFDFEQRLTGRFRAVGLLGNPDDVGVYLTLPVIAAFALLLSQRRWRFPIAIVAAVILGGLLASQTTTAIAATAAGLLAMGFLVSRKTITILLIGALSLAVLASLTASSERWTSVYTNFQATKHGDFDAFLSGRTLAFVVAWRMFQKHPLNGAGLGSFHFDYFDEKIAAEETFPIFMNRRPENFGETHNEHLQILAEAGLPGYALFLGALVILGRGSFIAAAGERASIARNLALPSAVSIAVLTLAQFPLRLAAPTVTMIVIVALTMSWIVHTDA